MTPLSTGRPARIGVRVALAATLACSGVIHAYLYIHGYSHIPTIGPAFLMQASGFCALAVLIAAGGPQWLAWAGAVLSVATLAGFALSRTIGLAGFTEHGWSPAPQAAISVIAELLTVAGVAANQVNSRIAAKSPALQPRSTHRNAKARERRYRTPDIDRAPSDL